MPLTIALDSGAAAEPIAERARAPRDRGGGAGRARRRARADRGRDPERALELGAGDRGFGGGLRLAGISCYPGHLRHGAIGSRPREWRGRRDASRARSSDVRPGGGWAARAISGGSTATLFRVARDPDDRAPPGQLRACSTGHEARGEFGLADCALHVQTTVVSTAVPGRFIVDAGAKTLSEAGPPPGAGGYAEVVGREGLAIEQLSEEHGHGLVGAGAEAPAVGERVELIPNHACTCVNLHDLLYGGSRRSRRGGDAGDRPGGRAVRSERPGSPVAPASRRSGRGAACEPLAVAAGTGLRELIAAGPEALAARSPGAARRSPAPSWRRRCARRRSSASGSITSTTSASPAPRPEAPLIFAKFPTAVIGPGEPIPIDAALTGASIGRSSSRS